VEHKIVVIPTMCVLIIAGLIMLYYGARQPVWVRLGYGARRYHGVSALVQGVPVRRPVRDEIAHERPNESCFLAGPADGDGWTDEKLAALDDFEPARPPVPVCILDRATIEEINWSQSWRDLDNRLEETVRGVDARLDVAWPEMMEIYRQTARNQSFILNKVQHEDFAGLMRADTAALRIMFAEVESHLADAEQLQSA
jgi:hypothetical protein